MIDERFSLAEKRTLQIAKEYQVGEPYGDYFRKTAARLELLYQEMDWVRGGGLEAASPEELERRNRRLYEDILPENYDACYGNPAYAVRRLGKDHGRLLSFLYAELHSQAASVYEQDREALLIRVELFLEVYQSFVCAFQESGNAPAAGEVRRILYWFVSDYSETETEKRVREQLAPGADFALRIIMESNLTDLRYLYRFGEYITENEKRLAVYMNSLAEEKVRRLADTYTEGYRIGFEVGNKDITKKRTVNIRYGIGFERMVRFAVENFRAMGLEPVIYRASESIFHKKGVHRVGYFGACANRQFLFDHKEDEAVYLDKKYVGRKLEALRAAYEKEEKAAGEHGGPACIEFFGESPFAPEHKAEACALTEEQQKLSVEYSSAAGEVVNRYIKGEERSFTIIAFPVPEIGERFEEIFDSVVEINTLDYRLYRDLQQIMIDTLDRAECVFVRGSGGNCTNLRVALQKLSRPDRETKFENCVADVNIPVGEVFTSPELAGTEGVLHVSRVFLNGLEYRDLKLSFREGMVVDYSCGNFTDPEAGRKYVRDNLLFHHATLPLGEFAIGTNTTAYAAARKYDIADKLPVLIAEKTGPHFAVGDTCYSHSEDVRVYNPDGKEIAARDNACSVLRTTDMEKAYFNCHTDITLPYDELGELSAVMENGKKIPLLLNGRFVLPGLEELNAPLDGV